MQIGISMPTAITEIICPSHKDHVMVKRTETKASVLFPASKLTKDFSLCISIENFRSPRLWLEV